MLSVSSRHPLRCELTKAVLVLILLNVYSVLANSARNGTLQKSTCNQVDCLRCDLETAECVKCLYVIMSSTRECHSACPPGYSTTWASHSATLHTPLMGRVCAERSMLALVSGRDVSIIAGAAVGGAVCVGVVIGALLYMRRRTKPPPDHPRHHHHHQYPIPRLWKDKRPKATEVSVDNEERVEFLRQLGALRGEAGNFLEMLSETRNKFRRLGGPDSATDTKAKAYRAVVRDLSRVLTLLNRRDEHILTVPGDWRRLLSWAARVLARYKRQKAAKEAGDIPSLEPLATNGTLYQTRRQAQAERCRLVAQGAPCCSPQDLHSLQGSFRSCESTQSSYKGSEGTLPSTKDIQPCSQMGSRSTSMISLTPMIVEEDEDEEEQEHDMKEKMEKEEEEEEEKMKKETDVKRTKCAEDMTSKDDVRQPPKEKEITITNVEKSSKLHNHVSSLVKTFNEYHRSPNTDYQISPNEILQGKKSIKETNNNITKNVTDMNHLNTIMSERFLKLSAMEESINKIRTMEKLIEHKNVPLYFKLDMPPIHDYDNNKMVPEDIRHQMAKDTKVHDPVKEKLSTRDSGIVADSDTLPPGIVGEDMYLSIVRKPVVMGVMAAGDPYRDDTIDTGTNNVDFIQRASRGTRNGVTPTSCKVEACRRLPPPRCELTTEL